jgi:hypothetical protein
MVVRVGDVQDGKGPGLLRVESFPEIARVLRAHHSIEDAFRVLLARLVIEDEGDLPAEGLALEVVVPELRGADSVAGEHHFALDVPARAEALGEEILLEAIAERSSGRGPDLERVGLGETRLRQHVGLEVGLLRTHGLQTEPLEAGADEESGDTVLGVLRQSAFQLVGREEEEVGLEALLADGVVTRGRRLRGERRSETKGECEIGSYHGR